MSNLTPRMEELLEALRSGVRVIYADGGMKLSEDYYFRTDTMKSCTKTVRALLRRGLVVAKKNLNGHGHSIILAGENSTPNS